MKRFITRPVGLLAGLTLGLAPLAAQVPTSPAGTGPFPAEKMTDARLPDHTIYRPRDLSSLRGRKLPIVAWANGGCRANGSDYKPFHLEIASHGYLLIANGAPGPDPVVRAELPMPASRMPVPPRNPDNPAASEVAGEERKTHARDLIASIDWAIAENARKGSRYFQRLDTRRIAVMGTSCGGLQALSVSDDPRITTSIIGNSGTFETDPGLVGVSITKDKLKSLHAPVLYINGGPTDIAYANGRDDFNRINHVPVVFANIDVGHAGTYRNANGGKAAPVAIAWLDWHLKGDRRAAAMFVGKDCGLCRNPDWTIERKNLK